MFVLEKWLEFQAILRVLVQISFTAGRARARASHSLCVCVCVTYISSSQTELKQSWVFELYWAPPAGHRRTCSLHQQHIFHI